MFGLLISGYISYAQAKEDRLTKNFFDRARKVYAKDIIPLAADAENLDIADMSLDTARELVKLTPAFTENTERRFADFKE